MFYIADASDGGCRKLSTHALMAAGGHAVAVAALTRWPSDDTLLYYSCAMLRYLALYADATGKATLRATEGLVDALRAASPLLAADEGNDYAGAALGLLGV